MRCPFALNSFWSRSGKKGTTNAIPTSPTVSEGKETTNEAVLVLGHLGPPMVMAISSMVLSLASTGPSLSRDGLAGSSHIFFLGISGSAMVRHRIMILGTGRPAFLALFLQNLKLAKALNYKTQPNGIKEGLNILKLSTDVLCFFFAIYSSCEFLSYFYPAK